MQRANSIYAPGVYGNPSREPNSRTAWTVVKTVTPQSLQTHSYWAQYIFYLLYTTERRRSKAWKELFCVRCTVVTLCIMMHAGTFVVIKLMWSKSISKWEYRWRGWCGRCGGTSGGALWWGCLPSINVESSGSFCMSHSQTLHSILTFEDHFSTFLFMAYLRKLEHTLSVQAPASVSADAITETNLGTTQKRLQ